MIYPEHFKKLIESMQDDNYVGIGNPNAKILIVGREGATEEDADTIKRRGEVSFADSWREKIKNNEPVEFRETRERALPEGHTWTKYQKLHDYIFDEHNLGKAKNETDFFKNFFVTEMNINRAKRTAGVSTNGMQERKNTFFRTEFIQQFPVTILACGNYIKNNDTTREIDDIFGVLFDRKYPNELTANNYSFWTHYNPCKTKLVIHTRQLSTDVPNSLLVEMANVINGFATGVGKFVF